MRRIIIGMALSLVFIAAVACSGDDGSATEAPAPPTSTPPVARATQAAIAPDLQEKDEAPAAATDSGPIRGGVFNTLWSDPPTMDPHLVTDGTSFGIVIEVFSGLVRLGADTLNPFEPDLAESWSVLEGGTVYEFKLRNDLKFSNGD
ncbi:MAG: ABC transporter substrate-binding protein, partial [Dehalococcoidia bacterium]